MAADDPIYIPLEDVDSEHCALIVDKGLEKVKGVQSHRVELNNRRAVITASKYPEEVVQASVKQIRDLGYEVPTIQKTFPVINMSCASCAGNVEATLNNQVGVVSAVVNYANNSAKIEFIPGLADIKTLREAVQGAGYDLIADESEEAKESLERMKEDSYKALLITSLL